MNENIKVVSSDLFNGRAEFLRRWQNNKQPWTVKQLENIDKSDLEAIIKALDDPRYGQLSCFKSNLEQYLPRITAYKGPISENINLISSKHKIDLIYLDADKSEENLNLLSSHFPDSILCGDDWRWGIDKGVPPMQAAVKNFTHKRNLNYTAKKATWIIHP